MEATSAGERRGLIAVEDGVRGRCGKSVAVGDYTSRW